MNDFFRSNRRLVTSLIYSIGEFSAEELKQKLRETGAKYLAIDELQTINDYLQDLAEDGALIYCNGRYSVFREGGLMSSEKRDRRMIEADKMREVLRSTRLMADSAIELVIAEALKKDPPPPNYDDHGGIVDPSFS